MDRPSTPTERRAVFIIVNRKIEQKQYVLRADAMKKDLEPSVAFRNSFPQANV